MKINVSEAVLCGCDTLSTQETEPANVIDSSVQPFGSTSDQSSGREQPPPPVTTTSVNPEPPAPSGDAPADASATPTSPVQTSSTTTFSFPSAGFAAFSLLPDPGFAAFSSPVSSSRQANFTNILGSAASTSSTTSPLDAPSPLRCGSIEAPVQANGPNASTSPFSFLPAAQDSGKTASAFPPPVGCPCGGFARSDVGISPTAPSGHTPKNPFGSFLHPFGPNPQTSLFLAGDETEQGSRYPHYAPTPDLDNSGGGPGGLIISISASNSHGHKSHEELRWEDYQKGDKGNYYSHVPGGFGWFPAHTVSQSLFASPSIIPDRPRMRTTTWQPQGNMNGLPMGFTNPTGLQRPHHEPVGVSPPASGCTACGATSSSSPSGHVGFTNPPSSAATTLPYGSMPLMFGAPNPAGQAYAVIFVPMTTITPAVQPYPMLFGTPNLVGQQGTTTTTPAVQPYTMMFGTPNLAAQATSTAPAFQPNMFGTPSFAGGQGTTTTAPAAHPYPMMFGTPSLAAQGTTTTPSAQPYAMMFGTPNLGAQGITPAAQAYPVNGLNLPFAAMNLQ